MRARTNPSSIAIENGCLIPSMMSLSMRSSAVACAAARGRKGRTARARPPCPPPEPSILTTTTPYLSTETINTYPSTFPGTMYLLGSRIRRARQGSFWRGARSSGGEI
eukprot:6206230-Pleurochrysis_carterae.AAC.2